MLKLNDTQKQILEIIYAWASKERVPITLKVIVQKMPDAKPRTVRASADALCSKGYLRRGIPIKNNNCYILIRTNSHD